MGTNIYRVIGMSGLACALTFLPGCILSQSVSKSASEALGSVSDSVRSVSDQATGVGDAEERLEREYRDDVRVAARDLVGNGASANELQRELGRIAELHGISDWEAWPGTMVAIGAGICEAGIAESELDGELVRLGRGGAADRERAHEGCRSLAL